jgi:NADH dehydrogenase
MTDRVVVVGAGYAGTGTVASLAEELDRSGVDAELVWINEHDYHLVLHEVHRVIRNPAVASKVTIPCSDLVPEFGEFRQGRVAGIDTDERTVELAGGDEVDYDYLMVGLGSATAFYGIEGLEEYSMTLKGLDDAREIHHAVKSAAADADSDDPTKVVVGGAGLSGIQCAGEIAEYRDDHGAPIDIELVEGLDQVFPGNDPEVQGAIRKRLEEKGIDISCGDFISKVDEECIYLGGGEDEDADEMDYDVLIWTGGITGQSEMADAELDKDERSNRVYADRDFQTSDDRVFALGDSALIDQGDDTIAPPTAQAAWQAAEVAGKNIVRAMLDRPLDTWTYQDNGTVISIGESAVAHDVKVPFGVGEFRVPMNTFGGPAAKTLKKAIATKWIVSISSLGNGLSAWGDM